MENRKPTESHEAAVAALYQVGLCEPFEYSCRLEIGEILRLHGCFRDELREEIRKGLCTPPGPLMAKITNKKARYFPARNLNELPDWELVFSRHEAPPNYVSQEPEIRLEWEDRRWMKAISVVLRPAVSDAVFFPDWPKVRDALKHPVKIHPPGRKEPEKPKPMDQATIDRILKRRQDSIDSFVSGMMEAAQKDSVTALPEQRIEA
ncbi:MAG: hypothetical protein JXM70_21900, partial [Pirellulales bacterium]|nr:hypothetical protein [Pirellulales bacterium]